MSFPIWQKVRENKTTPSDGKNGFKPRSSGFSFTLGGFFFANGFTFLTDERPAADDRRELAQNKYARNTRRYRRLSANEIYSGKTCSYYFIYILNATEHAFCVQYVFQDDGRSRPITRFSKAFSKKLSSKLRENVRIVFVYCAAEEYAKYKSGFQLRATRSGFTFVSATLLLRTNASSDRSANKNRLRIISVSTYSVQTHSLYGFHDHVIVVDERNETCGRRKRFIRFAVDSSA